MDATTAAAVLERYDPARYLGYAEMTALLQASAARWPDLCRLEQTGTSPEGRVVWSVTLTNFTTGPDTAKPAYHINGQHHAGELTASAAALYTIWWLLTEYGRDRRATELLDTRAVYVLPRIAVDGAEWYLNNPQMLRSSPLRYPEVEEPEGHVPDDVDGDGRILTMRIAHPDGEWRVSAADPRLLVRRRPEDREGTFYRLLPEGRTRPAYRGRELKPLSASAYDRERGFDFNRNYPTNWKPQHRQPGSGRYPFDRSEVRAMADFWVSHPNIGGAMSYHTYSGLNLRPSPLLPDEKLNQRDLALYTALGRLSEAITGYRTVSVYEEFTADYSPDRLDIGSWLEWAYDELGVLAFEMELWNWPYIAGVPKRPFKELKKLTDEEREQDELLKLQWIDRELGPGEGFIPWRPFDHPQYGRVEIGGYDPKYLGQNTPLKLLAKESHDNCLHTVELALALPLLRIRAVEAVRLGEGLYKLSVNLANEGYAPTNVTEVALRTRRTQPVTARLQLPGGARLAAGREKVEIGHLPGWGLTSGAFIRTAAAPVPEAWVDWVVRAAPGTVVTVRVEHDRGGTVERSVTL
jgi:murein tripeptide amidase MpaA